MSNRKWVQTLEDADFYVSMNRDVWSVLKPRDGRHPRHYFGEEGTYVGVVDRCILSAVGGYYVYLYGE